MKNVGVGQLQTDSHIINDNSEVGKVDTAVAYWINKMMGVCLWARRENDNGSLVE